jgi:hypothetical protein
VAVFGGDADEKRQTLLVKKFGSRMARRTRTAAKAVTDKGLLLTAAFLGFSSEMAAICGRIVAGEMAPVIWWARWVSIGRAGTAVRRLSQTTTPVRPPGRPASAPT